MPQDSTALLAVKAGKPQAPCPHAASASQSLIAHPLTSQVFTPVPRVKSSPPACRLLMGSEEGGDAGLVHGLEHTCSSMLQGQALTKSLMPLECHGL